MRQGSNAKSTERAGEGSETQDGGGEHTENPRQEKKMISDEQVAKLEEETFQGRQAPTSEVGGDRAVTGCADRGYEGEKE